MKSVLCSFRDNSKNMEPSPSLCTSADLESDPIINTQQTLLLLVFNKNRGALLSYLTRIVRSHEDAADLVQETYLRVATHIQSTELETITRAYLFQTATNLARDYFRRQRWRTHESLENIPETDVPAAHNSPDTLVQWRKAMESLDRALQMMPETSRFIFIRARVDGLPYADIAHELGISVRTVERRISEAMSLLASRLEEYL